jgi:hypothetical protein
MLTEDDRTINIAHIFFSFNYSPLITKCSYNFVSLFQVKVKDRSVIVTTDAETKVSQPSSLQELIDKETGKDQLNYILQGVTVLHCTL